MAALEVKQATRLRQLRKSSIAVEHQLPPQVHQRWLGSALARRHSRSVQ